MRLIRIRSIWIKAFICIFILMILPILLFSYFAQKSNVLQSLDQKQRSDLNSIRKLTTTLSVYLDSVEALGEIIAADDSVQSYLKQSEKEGRKKKSIYLQMDSSLYLSKYNNRIPYVIGCSLMDPAGYFIGEQILNRDRLYYYYNSTYMNSVKKSTPAWSAPFSIQFLKDSLTCRVISVLMPSISSTGELLGYVVLYVDTRQLKNFVSSFEDNLYILDASNYIIASKEDVPFYYSLYQCREINYSLLMEDKSVILSLKDDSVIVTTLTYDRINIKFVLVSSYNAFKEKVNQTFPSLSILSVYGILFSLLASALIAKLLTVPIVHLKETMDKVKDGNLEIRYEIKAQDEIAELGITFNSLMDTIERLMSEKGQQQKIQQKMHLQMIQEQVKPHFLYNVLEMINSLIRSGMSDKAMQSIQHLASFYRISLNSGSNIIDIKHEIQLVESYLTLQKLRYIEFMDFTLSFSPLICQYTIPKLTLQPIIENAIYHGLKEKCEKGMLCVTGYLENDSIIFEVFDTGCGISEDNLANLHKQINSEEEATNHFGLASVVKRLNLHYNNQAKLKIDSKINEYTCVTLTFPAIKL